MVPPRPMFCQAELIKINEKIKKKGMYWNKK